MKIDADLAEMYSGYYGSSKELFIKRSIAANDSVDHLSCLCERELGNVVDVGAGNGSVIDEIVKRDLCESISALEVSATGIREIEKRSLDRLRDVKKFDGYSMPFGDDEFDTALCIHVLEHVEHERMFLKELARIADRIYIEVPLEGGIRTRIDRRFGHINYYTSPYFLNLLETSGLRVVSGKVFTSSKAYEIHCAGKINGSIKHFVRNAVIKVAGQNLAPNFMTYLMGVVCEKTR